VLVTFRRPAALAAMLAAVDAQTLPLCELVVVDNAPSPEHGEIVAAASTPTRYLPARENLGPAGGLALGMDALLATVSDDDWILTLDDDDPPTDPSLLATLFEFACVMRAEDRRTGSVGLSGTRFDDRRGRIVRVPDEELHGAVRVDSIAGNQFPMYAAAAVREVGTLRPELFFGFEELELGLRMGDAGYALYAHGGLWHSGRCAGGRLGLRPAPSRALDVPTWRRYYSLRNLVFILRDRGRSAAALRVTAVTGFAKPAANLFRAPRLAWRHLVVNARACRDGWTGRMGRTVEPAA
jgi:glycosyltransferase involved in cell wall biosynthesis